MTVVAFAIIPITLLLDVMTEMTGAMLIVLGEYDDCHCCSLNVLKFFDSNAFLLGNTSRNPRSIRLYLYLLYNNIQIP